MTQGLSAQLLLDADGPGGTYALITSKLAPGYNPIEVPDCGHGIDHIDELFDADLNTNVFRFYLHVHEDDDRCINEDRQRCEIKSYNQSPDSLLGIEGEVVVYKWKFKLADGFQSSPRFTHIHQLKAVGGSESSMPLITFTTRDGNPDEFELRYAQSTSQVTLIEVDLAPFIDVWCEATETVIYGEVGSYDVVINTVSSNPVTLLSYTDNNIRMWRTNADFVRPKWGIYRSLLDSAYLRNEEVLFANFSIEEIEAPLPVELISFSGAVKSNDVELKWETATEEDNKGFAIQKSANGIDWKTVTFIPGSGTAAFSNRYSHSDKQPLNGPNYYRLEQIDFDGQKTYSNTIIVHFQSQDLNVQLFPNPATDIVEIMGVPTDVLIEVYNSDGVKVMEKYPENQKLDVTVLPIGIYFLNIPIQGKSIVKRLIKK